MALLRLKLAPMTLTAARLPTPPMKMAPPLSPAWLLLKLTGPVTVKATSGATQIAPPSFWAWLSAKVVVGLTISESPVK